MKYFWKRIAVALTLIMTFTLCFMLAGCGEKEKTEQEKFSEYLELDSKYGTIKLDSGTKVHLWYLEKESDYPNRVWVSLNYNTGEYNGYSGLYEWLKLSVEQKKKDLKIVGEKVVSFAKSNGWNNNYYLYVTISYGVHTQTIYDYEKEKLYVPNVDNIFLEMYEKFNTCSYWDIKDDKAGTDWLVSKGIGTYKHGEYEHNYSALDSMSIWCYDGKFSIRDTNKSTAY